MPDDNRINGRDERNLLEFPIGVSGKTQPLDESGQIAKEIVREVEIFDDDLGKCVPKRLVIRTSSKHAFVTGYDIEVLMGLFALHHQKDNFASPKLVFENSELYDLMRWPKGSGANNERLHIALDRFTGVQLTFENSFSIDGGKTKRKTYSTGVLDSYQFTKTSDVADDGKSWIRWSGELFVGFKHGNIKPLDTNAFFSLNRPVAQQAYRLLDDAFMRSDAFAMDLVEFATRVGVSSAKTGVIKQRLKPVIDELESLPGFIQSADPPLRYTKKSAGKWFIHFHKHSGNVLQSSSSTPSKAPPPSGSHQAAEELVRQFYLVWRGEKVFKVLAKERQLAEHLLTQYEPVHLRAATPGVVKELKLWKEARTFCATSRMWHQHIVKAKRRTEKTVAGQAVQPATPTETQANDLRMAWQKLPLRDRLPWIEQVHRTTSIDFVRSRIAREKYDDPLVEGECVKLWSKRTSA